MHWYYDFEKVLIWAVSLFNFGAQYTNVLSHSALKLEKSAISKVQKKHYLHFQKWQRINFCTRKKFKTTKNAIFGPKKRIFGCYKHFSGAKIDFLPFLKWQKMCFCTFKIALFSNFRAHCVSR